MYTTLEHAIKLNCSIGEQHSKQYFNFYLTYRENCEINLIQREDSKQTSQTYQSTMLEDLM